MAGHYREPGIIGKFKMNKIQVMLVDDSATMRQVLSESLKKHPDIQIIGTAADPIFAMEKMKRVWPDVIILDIEMPRMDGITFLKKIMSERPTPVVICSTLTASGAKTTLEAMAAGAVEVITKPKMGLKQFLLDSGTDLVVAIRAAAGANVRRGRPEPSPGVSVKMSADVTFTPASQAMSDTTDKVVAIGTSTGGTQALEVLLRMLPRTVPGIVIVQHMPEKFTAAFADRLNMICELEVREGRNGDRVLPGRALVAPGGRHMLLKRSGAQYHVEIVEGPPVNRHCPSVDVLFRSVAKFAGRNALGIIMTGMGDDGARGLKEMHDVGAKALAQNEETCVVYGMPKEAVKLGAVDRSLALDALAPAIIAYAKAAS
jgi:two-component system chemotaxis response regulator CheB